jgi:hypothetical protein
LGFPRSRFQNEATRRKQTAGGISDYNGLPAS